MKYKIELGVPYLYAVNAKNKAQAEQKALKLVESNPKDDWIYPVVKISKVN